MYHRFSTYRTTVWLLAATVVLLLAACHAQAPKEPASPAAQQQPAKQLYTCSMHPQIIRDAPGDCPICGMKLVKLETSNAAVADITLESLLRPTNQFVLSGVAVTTLQEQKTPIRIQAPGRVTYDTREEHTIAARTAGRIEKLYVRYRFQHIHQGQPLLELYSPELLTAQQNLLFVLKNDPDNQPLLTAARQKLLLLGMSEQQLQQVVHSGHAAPAIIVYSNLTGHIHEAGGMSSMVATGAMKDVSLLTEELPLKEGMYLQKGQTIFSVYDPGRAWALLNIYAGDEGWVRVGDAVSIVPETDSTKVLHGTINVIEPFFRADSKTLTARVYFDNSRLQIPIGSQVTAQITGPARNARWLPREAVLSLGLDNVVFLRTADGFRAHKIATGITYSDRIQVLSGLDASDEVAVNAQYLVDSESFIKTNNE